jgi:hypothetical protein
MHRSWSGHLEAESHAVRHRGCLFVTLKWVVEATAYSTGV